MGYERDSRAKGIGHSWKFIAHLIFKVFAVTILTLQTARSLQVAYLIDVSFIHFYGFF